MNISNQNYYDNHDNDHHGIDFLDDSNMMFKHDDFVMDQDIPIGFPQSFNDYAIKNDNLDDNNSNHLEKSYDFDFNQNFNTGNEFPNNSSLHIADANCGMLNQSYNIPGSFEGPSLLNDMAVYKNSSLMQQHTNDKGTNNSSADLDLMNVFLSPNLTPGHDVDMSVDWIHPIELSQSPNQKDVNFMMNSFGNEAPSSDIHHVLTKDNFRSSAYNSTLSLDSSPQEHEEYLIKGDFFIQSEQKMNSSILDMLNHQSNLISTKYPENLSSKINMTSRKRCNPGRPAEPTSSSNHCSDAQLSKKVTQPLKKKARCAKKSDLVKQFSEVKIKSTSQNDNQPSVASSSQKRFSNYNISTKFPSRLRSTRIKAAAEEAQKRATQAHLLSYNGTLDHSLLEQYDINGNKIVRIGAYTLAERRKLIQRYREKKKRRVWTKKIKYTCRKKLAEGRPRVKGRFVKAGEEANIDDDKSLDDETDDIFEFYFDEQD
jgi:hypothetical protein